MYRCILCRLFLFLPAAHWKGYLVNYTIKFATPLLQLVLMYMPNMFNAHIKKLRKRTSGQIAKNCTFLPHSVHITCSFGCCGVYSIYTNRVKVYFIYIEVRSRCLSTLRYELFDVRPVSTVHLNHHQGDLPCRGTDDLHVLPPPLHLLLRQAGQVLLLPAAICWRNWR